MKKLLILLSLFLLVGCSQNENLTFTAEIESINENSIIVTTKDDVSFDKASVSFNKSYKPDFELKIGISVEITILPEIRESKPVQVTAVKIEKLKDTDMGQYRKITGEKAQEMMSNEVVI